MGPCACGTPGAPRSPGRDVRSETPTQPAQKDQGRPLQAALRVPLHPTWGATHQGPRHPGSMFVHATGVVPGRKGRGRGCQAAAGQAPPQFLWPPQHDTSIPPLGSAAQTSGMRRRGPKPRGQQGRIALRGSGRLSPASPRPQEHLRPLAPGLSCTLEASRAASCLLPSLCLRPSCRLSRGLPCHSRATRTVQAQGLSRPLA